MTPEALHSYCMSLPATSHVVQWSNSDVWKVGGKVFAIAGRGEDGFVTVSFKVSPMAFEILKDQPGCRGAPYMASRGMTWIQVFEAPGLTDDALKDYVRESWRIVAEGLTRKLKNELGLFDK